MPAKPVVPAARHAIYLNGLSNGKISMFEKYALKHAAKNNILIKHIPVNWLSRESLDELLNNIIEETESVLNDYGSIIIVGASAGGSLAINTYARLQNKNVKVITLCSRINETKLAWWDLRSLRRMAHLGTKRESKLFYSSVSSCTNNVLPNLTNTDKQNIVCVSQLLDEIVPKRTMKYAGMHNYGTPIVGHRLGIIFGLLDLRKMLT